jgi:hypothetical protein
LAFRVSGQSSARLKPAQQVNQSIVQARPSPDAAEA